MNNNALTFDRRQSIKSKNDLFERRPGMRVIIFYLVVITFMSADIYAQCPVADFTSPGTVCKNQSVSVINTSTNATALKWDFCDGSILNTPTTSSGSLALGSNPNCVSSQIENGNIYSFVVNRGSGKLLRLEFGTQVVNPPTVVDLGNCGVLQTPQGIKLYQEGTNYYALVTDSDGSIYRLSFGNSVKNTPTGVKLSGLTGLTDMRQLSIVNDNGHTYALIAGGGSAGILCILDFGSSILNTPTQTNISIGASFLTGIDVANDCNQWYVLVEGYSSGVFSLNFGSSLANTPTISAVGSISAPLNIKIVKSSGSYYAFVPTDTNNGLVRLNFGSSLSNTNPAVTNLGNFSNLSLAIAFEVIRLESKYYALAINFMDNKITTFNFPKDCPITSDYSGPGNSNITVAYPSTGSYAVTLTAYDNNGNVNTKTQTVTVSSLTVPDIDFANVTSCVTSPVTFNAINSSGDITTYAWDFGDGNTSSVASPSNSYNAANSYSVSLTVNASNGCSNSVKKDISVFNPPVADFSLPAASPICSNQQYTFTNTSTYDAGASPAYQWKVNNADVSTATDLNYSFSNTSDQKIDLVAAIPGCTNTMSKIVSSISSGPLVDFSSTGNCLSDTFLFTNNTQGNPDSYTWVFDDGQQSTALNPQHVFSTTGSHQISLTAFNSTSGCNNSATKSVTVYSSPQPDFSLALPPFSCSGSDSQFNDATPSPTDSNLQGWQWDFGDASSGQNSSTEQNPTHLYATAGDYDVSLTVTTDFNCSATVQKTVTISQSPDATITNTPTCKDQTVQFNATKTDIQSWYWQIGNTFYFIDNPTYVFTSVGNHDVFLTITGANGCVSSADKTITVPAQLSPDFSTEKNCVGENTKFIDTTPPTADPVADEVWDFSDGSTGQGSPAYHAFNGSGDYNITMVVQSQAGCYYSIVKKVTVVNSPVASFTASPETGVPPLAVQFTNKSTNATSYQWAFNDADNSTTTSASPTFTFNDYGDFVVDLTATNDQGCSSTFSKIIRAALPVNDVALTALNVTDAGDGTWKCIATFKNDGNLNINDVQLVVDISGGPAVRENITSTILPGATLNHALGFEIFKASDLNYICAEAVIPNDNNNSNNKLCSQIGQTSFIFQTYPNPASDKINVEWISADEESTVTISLIDAIGKQVIATDLASIKGLNKFTLDTQGLQQGMYVLTIQAGAEKKNQKIVVSR